MFIRSKTLFGLLEGSGGALILLAAGRSDFGAPLEQVLGQCALGLGLFLLGYGGMALRRQLRARRAQERQQEAEPEWDSPFDLPRAA